jgi:hypothetical protein
MAIGKTVSLRHVSDRTTCGTLTTTITKNEQ